jgi:hypothetical protein
MYFMYQIYQLVGNASVTLNLLSLGPERKMKCYNEYFINGMYFILKSIVKLERHITMRYVLRDQLLMSLKLITMKC